MRKLRMLFVMLASSMLILVAGCKKEVIESSHNHIYGNWYVITEATCTTEGLNGKICSCGDIVTKKIDPKGHKLVKGDKVMPSCEKTGNVEYYICNELLKVEVEEGSKLTTIGESAFNSCDVLLVVSIPNVETVGSDCFAECGSLLEIIAPEGWSNSNVSSSLVNNGKKDDFKIINNEYLFVKGEDNIYKLSKYFGSEKNIILPETTFDYKIIEGAFSDIESIHISSNVVEISNEGLRISSLNEVTFSENSKLKTIDAYAFQDANISEIILPQSVLEIDSYVFYFCDELVSITMSNSVTDIASNALYHCDNLTTINYNGTINEWNTLCENNVLEVYKEITVICNDGTVTISHTV